ncbi:tetratricopeptide repeat protein [Actinoallomurus soli]|uniref:tetratricopeptide repeat protein n=1 Tax=Actinoallomurus soli TaxID=2952535 RepID=UPI0020934731|nr:tetratricopeptide repeat protein [Actinoallomurus soli]MCO5967534.1 tetratricopeptide repeat protein [Actinoallomurus soli]
MGRLQGPVDQEAPEPMRDLAERLRRVTDAADFAGVRELAKTADLGHTTVSDALSGGRAPSWQTVRAILKACGVQANNQWLGAQERAKAAEREWRQAARVTGGTPATASAQPETTAPAPGMFSIRPPFGELPTRVRGRDALLEDLRACLVAPPGRIQVLHGLGGCGKTTVALRLAHDAREQGFRVFWVSAEDKDRLITGMREVTRELGATEKEISDGWTGRTSAMDLVWRYLDSAAQPWLLVIDTADEPIRLAAENGSPGDGTGWARPSERGLTLVTSRVGTAETWGGEADCHHVGVLTPEDGAEVLIDLAGHAGTGSEARLLAERLGGLPLALRLAGSYLARTARGAGLLRHRGGNPSHVRTFAAYQEALGDVGTALLDRGARGGFADDGQAERLHRRLIGRTWELTLGLLDTQGLPEARSLMRLLSCFAATPFPVDLIDIDIAIKHGLVPATTLIERIDQALEALVDISLLEVTDAGASAEAQEEAFTCVKAHRLVLESNAEWLRASPSKHRTAIWRAAAEMLELGTRIAPEAPQNWVWWRLLSSHIFAAVETVQNGDQHVLSRLLKAGLNAFSYLWFSGNFEDGKLLASLLRRRSEELDSTDPIGLSIRHRYALAHMQGEEEHAEYGEILAAQRKALGADHPETLITHHQFAASLFGSGDLAEAEAGLRAVLEARRRVLGPSNPYTLITRGELARIMNKRGHSEEAVAEYKKIIEHSDGDHRFLSLDYRHQLAHVLDSEGRYAEAEKDYRSIIRELERADARDSNLYRDMKRCLAWNLRSQKRNVDACVEFQDFLSLFGRDHSEDSAAMLASRHELGDLLRSADRPAHAEAEIRAVLDLRRRAGGEEDSVVLRERHCLAHAIGDQGRYDEAVQEMRTVVTAYEDVLEDDDETMRTTRYCLGWLLRKAGRLVEARDAYEAVLEAEMRTLGSDHHETLMTRFQLIQVRHALQLIDDEAALTDLEAVEVAMAAAVGEDDRRVSGIRSERDVVRQRLGRSEGNAPGSS